MIGYSIRKIRETRKITQERMARILGVSRQAVCMWEANRREPKLNMLHKIARALDVSMDEIVSSIRTGKKREGEKMPKKDIKKKVSFEIMAPEAKKVLLSGDFNSWNTEGTPLKKQKTGLWKTTMTLGPGKYEYKFIIDGQWVTDPTNSYTNTNSLGSHNSVKEV